MGLHDVTTMNSIRTALDNLYADGSGSQILMYGEAWDMQPIVTKAQYWQVRKISSS